MATLTRRSMLGLTAAAAVSLRASPPALLFDGRSLAGWIQIENSATAFSTASILDPSAFAASLAKSADPVPALLRARLDPNLRTALAAFDPASAAAKTTTSDLVKQLNAIVAGPPLYAEDAFAFTALRSETVQLLHEHPEGQQLARLNKILIEDAFTGSLAQSVTTGWTIKDGALASTGSGRGVIYTAADYGRFRLLYSVRHVSGNPDHQPCALIFCARPKPGEKPLDALGGIQFQGPNSGHWDYRPGKNNAGDAFFTKLSDRRFDNHQWSRVEIIADASTGSARMAVAQPLGARAIELVAFRDPAAGRPGPIALQMHNAGLFDEYKDVTIELDPGDSGLITTR